MSFRFQSWHCAIPVVIGLSMVPTRAHADINGFGDFSNFTFNQSDGNANPTISPGVIHLTNAAAGEVRSVFDDTPQNISQFTASFGFQAVADPTNPPAEFGATFIIQNDGVNQVATNDEGIGGTFGYQNWRIVYGQSVAISLEDASLSSNSSATALYSGGVLGGGANSTSPVNLFNGDLIDVTLSYNGSILHENLLDTVSDASFDEYYVANIPSLVDSSTALIGFTANTADTNGAMDFSNLQFTSSVPEPCSAGLVALGTILGLGMRQRRG